MQILVQTFEELTRKRVELSTAGFFALVENSDIGAEPLGSYCVQDFELPNHVWALMDPIGQPSNIS